MRYVILFFITVFSYGAEAELRFENTNFIMNSRSMYDDKPYTYDYNRFRATADLSLEGVRFKLIADNENIASSEYLKTPEYAMLKLYEPDIPFETRSEYTGNDSYENSFKLYRAYAQYFKGEHSIRAGLMRVPFGVGRIWTPVDMFNPLDSLSLETDEREGVYGARYEYAMSSLSAVEFIVSQTKEQELKKAARIKGYLDFADFAIIAVDSEELGMLGYEFDSEIMDTDIGFRSEGGRFTDKRDESEYLKYIIGLDYGFENSFTFALEYLYSGLDELTNMKRENSHVGFAAAYQPSPLWILNIVSILNPKDESAFFSPNATYSLSDEQTLSVGMTGGCGDDGSEYGTMPETYYVKWYIHF